MLLYSLQFLAIKYKFSNGCIFYITTFKKYIHQITSRGFILNSIDLNLMHLDLLESTWHVVSIIFKGYFPFFFYILKLSEAEHLQWKK